MIIQPLQFSSSPQIRKYSGCLIWALNGKEREVGGAKESRVRSQWRAHKNVDLSIVAA